MLQWPEAGEVPSVQEEHTRDGDSAEGGAAQETGLAIEDQTSAGSASAYTRGRCARARPRGNGEIMTMISSAG